MSVRGVEILRSLCKLIIRQNREGGLKSPLDYRSAVVRDAQNILALMKLKESSKWIDNSDLDALVAQLRATAREKRLSASIRIQAIRRLAAIEGLVTVDGKEPVDDLIRKLTSVGKPSAQKESAPPDRSTTLSAQQHADLVNEFSTLIRK
jgi:hypothetical protein